MTSPKKSRAVLSSYVPLAHREFVDFPRRGSRKIPALIAVAVVGGLIALSRVVFAQSASQPAAVATGWQTQLLELACAALLTGLTYLVGQAKAYFAAHAKSALGQYASGVFDRLSAQALTSVQAVEQLAQKDLAAGLTKANSEKLKADALAYLRQAIGPAGLAELAGIVGLDQVSQVLGTHVEAAVLQVNTAAVASGTK